MARGRRGTSVADPVALAEDGELGAVLLLYGDDPETARRVAAALRTRLLEPGMEAFDHEILEGRTLEAVAPVLGALAQPPVASRRRLVELVEPSQIGPKKASGDAKASASRQAVDALVAYLERPNDRAFLLVTAPDLDGRSRLVKAAAKVGHAVRLGALEDDRDALAFVRAEAKRRGIRLGPGADAALVEAVEPSRALLATALETAAHHHGGSVVEVEDVAAVVPESRKAVVFELTDAIGEGDVGRALDVLRRVFADRSVPARSTALQLTGLLAHQVRNLWLVHLHGQAARTMVRLPPFVLRKLARQAARFDEGRLRAIHRGLVALDRSLKGSDAVASADPRAALEAWILAATGVLEPPPS